MTKRVEAPIAVVGRQLSRATRREAIEQGAADFKMHGWKKDPPWGLDDPRRWFWQNGADAAEAAYLGRGSGRLSEVPGWH